MSFVDWVILDSLFDLDLYYILYWIMNFMERVMAVSHQCSLFLVLHLNQIRIILLFIYSYLLFFLIMLMRSLIDVLSSIFSKNYVLSWKLMIVDLKLLCQLIDILVLEEFQYFYEFIQKISICVNYLCHTWKGRQILQIIHKMDASTLSY